MKKPTFLTKSAIDWNEAKEWIDQQLGYDIRDTLDVGSHYENWCGRNGFKSSSDDQQQYSQYKSAEDGERDCPEYRDYWHFLIECRSIHDGGTVVMGSDLLEDCESWQAEITQAFIDHFGDDCEFWTDW